VQLGGVVVVATHDQTPPGQVHWYGVAVDVSGVAAPSGQSLGQSSIVAPHTALDAHGSPVGRERSGRTPASLNGTALDSFAHCGPSGFALDEHATTSAQAAHADARRSARWTPGRRKARGLYSNRGRETDAQM
jgi:hypothetical protein